MWQEPKNGPEEWKTGRGDWATDKIGRTSTGSRRVAIGTEQGKSGDRRRHATSPWDWETGRHGVVNYG